MYSIKIWSLASQAVGFANYLLYNVKLHKVHKNISKIFSRRTNSDNSKTLKIQCVIFYLKKETIQCFN